MKLNRSKESQTPITDNKLDVKLNIKDLETLQEAFSLEGEGHNDLISLNRDEFVEALSLVLCKGSREGYSELFDKIDITREGFVDWEKFASHMLLEFYEKDDRTKSSSLPQWKDLKTLLGPHKDVIQRIILIKNLNRYLSISKEGNVGLWGSDLKLQRTVKTHTDSCRLRDLWVTDFVYLSNVNKVAVSFTSKEIAFYDMSAKLEFNCQVRLQHLLRIPICMDYWNHHESTGEAILVWGDAGGFINVITWQFISSTLFERTTATASDKDENMTVISLIEIVKGNIKTCTYFAHKAHDDWVRKVSYLPNLECFVSCATNWNTSMVICWLEKQNPSNSTSSELAGSKEDLISETQEGRGISKTSSFTVHQGINSFAYNENMNLIATAGVNFHVCLWNPYVISKPNGLLRGHMASVTDVQFKKDRGLLFSFSKDKILRIWDVQLQVCIQRLAGVFPKGQESALMNPRIILYCKMYFHEEKMRLFITFNFGLAMLEMKPDTKDKIISHEKPLIGCLYNSLYNQVVTACQGGIVYCWMVDTGQRVKTIADICPGAELTCITQDVSQTRLYTGATNGIVKIYDFSGHCYNELICAKREPADISQIVILKRCVLVFGFSKQITAFWTSSFKKKEVEPSEWNGIQAHSDDILSGASIPPHAIATGAYDGEIIIWNINSEQVSRKLTQRSQEIMKRIRHLGETHNTNKEEKDVSKENEVLDSQSMSKITTEETTCTTTTTTVNTSGVKTASSSSTTTTDTVSDMMDCMFNISRLIYLETRKKIKHGGGGNLVSCGGNGIVRFWNLHEAWLIGEFIAHESASNIIMNIDGTNQYLATADMEGKLKVWDISEYCLTEEENGLLGQAPKLVNEWQCHSDDISGIAFCSRFGRVMIITSSADQSAGLWELTGHLIGRFGQELRWKLSSVIEGSSLTMADLHEEEIVKKDSDLIKYDPNWSPDPEATQNPSQYRINTWNDTTLGKDYQELRIKKRERVQPSTIPDLPYLFGEKLGRPTFGPFYSLGISNFEDIEELDLPEFMDNPDKFFNETENYLNKTARVPLMADNMQKMSPPNANVSNMYNNKNNNNLPLKAVFDERSLLPKYILDFEQNMRHRLKIQFSDTKTRSISVDHNISQEVRKPKNVRLQPIRESLKRKNKLTEKLDS